MGRGVICICGPLRAYLQVSMRFSHALYEELAMLRTTAALLLFCLALTHFELLSATATALSYRVVVPRGATVFLLLDKRLTITDSDAKVVPTRVTAFKISLADSNEI